MLYEKQTTNYPDIKFSSENLKQQFYQTIGELYVSNQHRSRQLVDSCRLFSLKTMCTLILYHCGPETEPWSR